MHAEIIKKLISCSEIFQIDAMTTEYNWLPIGGKDKENNSGIIHLNPNQYDAVGELITNAYDSIIEDFGRKNGFPSHVKNGEDALAFISENLTKAEKESQIFLFANKNTVQVVDRGTGIPADRMQETILSLLGSNKVSNPLSLGSYNIGGSSIYAHSKINYIFSRVADSDEIAFTVCMEMFKPGWKNSSYVYLTDKNENMITVTIDDLTAVGINVIDPRQVNSKNCEEVLATSLIIPDKGVVRRIIGMKATHYSTHGESFYSSIPNKIFGFSDIPVHMVAVGGAKKPVYNLDGTRQRLERNFKTPRKHKPLAHIAQKTIPVPGYGSISIETWILDSYKNTTRTIYPTDTYCSGSRSTIDNMFFTYLGQTHGRERSKIMLRKADLASLEKYLICEINMNGIRRLCDATSANRASLNDEFLKVVTQIIIDYLKGHEELYTWNSYFAKRLNGEAAATTNTETALVQLYKLFDNPMAGSIFAGFGPVGKTSEQRPVRTEPREIMVTDSPTYIEIHKDTIMENKCEWFQIETDACDSFADKIHIKLPPFLEMVDKRKELSNGKMSVLVRAKKTAVNGMKGEITVCLRHSNNKPVMTTDSNGVAHPVCDARDITVVNVRTLNRSKAKTKETANDNVEKQSLPEITSSWLDIFESGGEGYDVGDLERDKWNTVAYDVTFGTNIHIRINPSFGPWAASYEQVKSVLGDNIADRLKNEYVRDISLKVFGQYNTMQEMGGEEIPSTLLRHMRTNDAKVDLIRILLNYPTTQTKKLKSAA